MEKEPEPNKDQKIQNLRSAVWLSFTRIKKGTRAMCNFCKKDYAAIPGKNGTSTLKRHLDNCGKYQNTLADKKQKTLTRVEGGGEGKTADVVPTIYNYEVELNLLDVGNCIDISKAFERMEDDDELYNSYFNESDSGRKREGPPNMVHWNKAKKFVRFLKTFYEVTLKFSATLSVTSNLYFNEICKILSLLNSMSGLGDLELATMATNMKRKFNKYWSSADQVNKLLIVSVVLDPRQKLDFVQFCFAAFYEPTKAEELGKDIKNLLVTLYDIYNAWSKNSGCSSSGTNGTQNSNIVQLSSQDVTLEVDPNDFLVSFRKLKERKLDIGAQNEVESVSDGVFRVLRSPILFFNSTPQTL
ncbi:hypothetical protein LWI29_029252 [Acer saccharum]|uniref:BED-type domain-containing protein n=1 Tax=Acer saccharum TaxID=4024 RepID=A0AA39TNC0_ACESA|nr:hypothetical protein LWI29_029252 [Acer saccharum]